MKTAVTENQGIHKRDFRLILPKKGRLKADFDKIMAESCLNMVQDNERQDFGTIKDQNNLISPFETLLQRPKDAFGCLVAGVADMAVVGLDSYLEFNAAQPSRPENPPLRIQHTMNRVSRCNLCIAAPTGRQITSPRDLSGLRIATSYPALLQNWLDSQDLHDVMILCRDGGAEDTIRLGLADAIFDVVQSGASLDANGLDIKFTLAQSCAVLVSRTGEWNRRQADTASALLTRLDARQINAAPSPAPLAHALS